MPTFDSNYFIGIYIWIDHVYLFMFQTYWYGSAAWGRVWATLGRASSTPLLMSPYTVHLCWRGTSVSASALVRAASSSASHRGMLNGQLTKPDLSLVFVSQHSLLPLSTGVKLRRFLPLALVSFIDKVVWIQQLTVPTLMRKFYGMNGKGKTKWTAEHGRGHWDFKIFNYFLVS